MLKKLKFPFNTFKMIYKIIHLCKRKVSLWAIHKIHLRWNTLRALSTLRGLRGAPEVPPLCRETAVSRTANVGTWLRKRNGGQKWVKYNGCNEDNKCFKKLGANTAIENYPSRSKKLFIWRYFSWNYIQVNISSGKYSQYRNIVIIYSQY